MNTHSDLRARPGTARRGWDPLPVVSILIATLVTAFNVVLTVAGNGFDAPTTWVVGLLIAAILLGGYGTARAARRRRAALIGSGVILTVLGVLTIMSVGLLLIAAGVLTLIAAARSAPDPTT